MTKIKTPEPLANSASANRLHPSIVPSSVHRVSPSTPASTRKPRRPLSPSEVRQRAADREEMQSLLAKLKQLVPGIPKKRKLSKLEIIQHVIDYIFDLQVALESHPIAGVPEFLGFPAGVTINHSTNQPLEMAAVAAAASFVSDPSYQFHHHQSSQFTCDSTEYSLPQSCDPSAHQMVSQRISSARPERQPLASIML